MKQTVRKITAILTRTVHGILVRCSPEALRCAHLKWACSGCTLLIAAASWLPGLQAAWPWDGQVVTVQSEVFRSAAYTRANRTLVLEFKRGGSYQYRDVPPMLYDNFLGEIDKGRFFNRRIRGQYKTERLESPSAATKMQELPAAVTNSNSAAACVRNEVITTNNPHSKKD